LPDLVKLRAPVCKLAPSKKATSSLGSMDGGFANAWSTDINAMLRDQLYPRMSGRYLHRIIADEGINDKEQAYI
jgi:hypothetical protein